jgi:hypothetical protein
VSRGGAWKVCYPCTGPDHFIEILLEQADDSIERLDIVDHGGPGHISLGSVDLFRSDRDAGPPLVNAALVTRIRDKLTASAQVRLLGCETAAAFGGLREGRLLLVKLAKLLNQSSTHHSRIVFGTINGIQPEDFDEHGLRRGQELTLLYSSFTALDYDSPTYDQRAENVASYEAGRLDDSLLALMKMLWRRFRAALSG